MFDNMKEQNKNSATNVNKSYNTFSKVFKKTL